MAFDDSEKYWDFSINSFHIQYIIPVAYSKSIFPSPSGFFYTFNLYPILEVVSLLPNDIRELSRALTENIIDCSIIGDKKIFLCDSESMTNKYLHSYPFLCFLSTENTYETVKNFISDISPKPIHITTKAHSEGVYIDEARKKFTGELNRIIDYLNSKFGHKLKKISQKAYSKDNKIIHYCHNITDPNRFALLSQHIYSKNKFLILPNRKQDYQKFIANSANYLIEIKKKINFKFTKNDLILALPAIKSSLYNDKEYFNTIRKNFGPLVEKLFKKLIKRKEYAFEIDDKDVELLKDPVVQRFIHVHSTECLLFTSIFSILSCENFSPLYRLPNSINLSHNIYNKIVSLSKQEKDTKIKLNRVYKELTDAWSSRLDDLLLDSIRKAGHKILMVSDCPLEWLCLDRVVPLSMSHNICRINSFPGDFLIHQICHVHNIVISPNSLEDILILRSFDEARDQNIKDCLAEAIKFRQSENQLNKLKIKVVDICTENELISNLNEFCGNIVIFDCHGGHSGYNGEAWLIIGGKNVNVWNLKSKTKVPAIIILSACATHPINGSSSSVANGLLSSGAHSVIATLLPIDANHSARLVSKILHWIDFYISINIEDNMIFALWRDIVSEIMRSMYASDILEYFIFEKKIIDSSAYESIRFSTSMDIMRDKNPKWFESLFIKLSQLSRLNYEDLIEIYKKETRFTDSLYYSHIGRPDKIIIKN